MSSETLLTFPQVSARVGLGSTTIYARMACGTFPKQVKVGGGARWVESEIDAWIADLIKSRMTQVTDK